MPGEKQQPRTAEMPQLQRVLGLWDLIFYGIVLIQPIAAVGLLGVGMNLSQGHMVTVLLVTMAAMMLTAISYGRMASLYPAAGSAYTYVGRGLNPHLGFLAGWAMFLDYLIVPVINLVYSSSLFDQQLMPEIMRLLHQAPEANPIPRFTWVVLFGVLTTILNCRGIKITAKTNIILLFTMLVVIVIFIVEAVTMIVGNSGFMGLFTLKPFYNPQSFSLGAMWAGSAFVALTYIGFDGITTLAEDVKNPKRNVLLATVLVCLFTGISGAFEIYLAQIIWPNYQTFPNLDTAFMDVCRRVGGSFLSILMSITLLIACFASAMAGQVGAARLLFGMGRDGVLPRKLFSRLDAKHNTPIFNIVFMGLLAVAVATTLVLGFGEKAYGTTGQLLNFGAFLAFMGVNIATFRQFYFLSIKGYTKNFLRDAFLPVLGFVICAVIWLYLSKTAKEVGGIWFALGLTYLAITTKGFRKRPVMIDFSEG